MSGCIVAYMGEGQRYSPLVERSIEVAKARDARLILYDADSASMFSSPLPTVWSADGEAEQFDDKLSPRQLEKVGKQELRDHVAHAREVGVNAYGWPATKRDAKEFAAYASSQDATLVIIPSHLEKSGLGDWLKGRPSGEQLTEETDQPVMEVELEPEPAKA